MNDDNIVKRKIFKDNELNLQELFFVIIRGRRLIFLFTFASFILATIYSLSLPNIYQSKALLNAVQQEEAVPSIIDNLGGLASIAGIDLNAGGNGNSAKALEKLNSLSFFSENIMPYIFLPNLMAVDSWDPSSNKIKFDGDLYDEKSKSWVRDFSYPQKQVPSPQESFIIFKSDHLDIKEDSQTGFISLSIRHQSPYIAYKWAELVIDKINLYYREKDKANAEKAVSYLKGQMSKTNLSEIKQALAQLIQIEIKKITLIEANNEYVFDYIDPPVVMERKTEPFRTLIIVLGIFMGAIIGSIAVIFRHLRFYE